MILLVRSTASELPLGLDVVPTGDAGFDATGKLDQLEVWIASCRTMRDGRATVRIWIKPADLVDEQNNPLQHADVCRAVNLAREQALDRMRHAGPLGDDWP